ncbi:MliC family protein [Chryseobacterium sp.]|uniref:MliC family protein n=1 Tax=Chryseobacterium sp. TaxID=1871047 RepID=UPI0025C26D5D|nr:MliC family protein [Chryseobacterium sp.]MBV8328661.1 MliC family protein [Chryseobacterium sp.]
MKKNIFGIAVLTALALTSCKQEKATPGASTTADSSISQESAKDSITTASSNDIVKSTLKDATGKNLEVTFDNTKDVATFVFNGENLELKGQKPASGIWYKNDHYELRGKGDDVQLSKDGKVVFKSVTPATASDDIVKSTLKDNTGKSLEVTFDNTKDMATFVFNGENLELKGQKPASGIWYKNDHYELRGKGDDVQLSKDGKVVFKNVK